MQLSLPDLEHTAHLGQILAHGLAWDGACPFLIIGPLGAGKTTLIRHIVSHLPGGELAEVSSPSFNLVNIYPTRPEVVHMDLYRLGQVGVDESLAEYLDAHDVALLVEWAEYLPESLQPANFIRLQIQLSEQERAVYVSAHGAWAEAWLQKIMSNKCFMNRSINSS